MVKFWRASSVVSNYYRAGQVQVCVQWVSQKKRNGFEGEYLKNGFTRNQFENYFESNLTFLSRPEPKKLQAKVKVKVSM